MGGAPRGVFKVFAAFGKGEFGDCESRERQFEGVLDVRETGGGDWVVPGEWKRVLSVAETLLNRLQRERKKRRKSFFFFFFFFW